MLHEISKTVSVGDIAITKRYIRAIIRQTLWLEGEMNSVQIHYDFISEFFLPRISLAGKTCYQSSKQTFKLTLNKISFSAEAIPLYLPALIPLPPSLYIYTHLQTVPPTYYRGEIWTIFRALALAEACVTSSMMGISFHWTTPRDAGCHCCLSGFHWILLFFATLYYFWLEITVIISCSHGETTAIPSATERGTISHS